MSNSINSGATQLGPLLLDIGIAMLRSGASSGKIRMTLLAIARAYHYEPHIDLTGKSISLNLHSSENISVFNEIRSADGHGINFRIIAGIGRLIKNLNIDPLPLQRLKIEVDQILKSSHYPRYLVLLMVSVAGAAFCFTLGGSAIQMAIAFAATFFGLFIKQELTKRRANSYLCTYIAAVAATSFIGLFYKLGLSGQLEQALTTSVLFLVPGVPLINSFTDLLEGEILNGLEKSGNAIIHALAIAAGMATVLFLFNFQR